LELPKNRIEKEGSADPVVTILYGSPKIGKTEVLSHLHNFLHIDLENGATHINGLIVNANNFDDLTEIGKAIIKAGKPYNGVIIDTITEMENWCEWDATKMYMDSPMGASFNKKGGNVLPFDQWNSVLSLPMGSGYHWLRMSYKKWVAKLEKLAPHIILVAHIKDKFLDKETDSTITPKELDLTGQIKRIACANADAIGFLYRNVKQDNELRVSFQSNDNYLAGSRCKHLRNQDFVLCVNNPDGSVKEHNWNKIFTHQQQ
jgi:hypothetical protein